jgi:small subunit ribosomal protein S9
MATSTPITVGRRKTAVARVQLISGNGVVTINGKSAINFLKKEEHLKNILQPFAVTGTEGTYDVRINVNGGGFRGQIDAIKLGIARSLVEISEELKPPLRKSGFMTRDPRMVERKKYGRPKARKRFQFSKR